MTTATTNTYDIGDQVRTSVAFTTTVGTPVDPTAVTFRLRKPSGIISILVYGVDAAVVKDSVGNYHVDVTVDLQGIFAYRYEGTGAAVAACEGRFVAQNSDFYVPPPV
jgi:hypothetical protein